MDETIEYSSEEQMRKVSSTWALSHSQAASTASLWKDTSNVYLQYKNVHLHLVQKCEYPSERRKIPSTKAERYSYYRNLTTSVNRCTMFNSSSIKFNTVFWYYLFNVFFKSLPHTFTNLFLASYAPEEHLFVSKMVPFFYGSKFAFIVTYIYDFLHSLYQFTLTFSYFVHGVMYKAPWNRCKHKEFNFNNKIIGCLEPAAFATRIKNTTSWAFVSSYYMTSNGERFQVAQLTYFRNFKINIDGTLLFIFYFTFVCILISSLQSLVASRLFWKIQHRMQLFLIFTEITIFLYLIFSYFRETEVIETVPPEKVRKVQELMAESDLNFLAESIVAPPVVHVLTARSTQDISPSNDAFIICLSNTASYFYRGLMMSRLKNHCKNMIGASVQYSYSNMYSFNYLWPLFFSQFYWGDLYTFVFFLLNLTVEVLTLTITYHCFLETMINEWTFLKKWMISTIFFGICITLCYLNDLLHIFLVRIYTMLALNFVEICVIYYVYPVGRLVDDVIFHSGAPPTRLTVVVWRLLPGYYFIKMAYALKNLALMHGSSVTIYMLPNEWAIVCVPYLIGMIYIIIKYTYKERRSWHRMFVPNGDWGPRDHQERQLRKLFNSRTFIRSQADRHLSRYMLAKQEAKAYQLSMNYDPKRRSTMPTTQYRMEAEKKDS